MENVAKHLPRDREFAVCGEKHNNFMDCRLILDWFFFLGIPAIFTPVIAKQIFGYLSTTKKIVFVPQIFCI